MSAKNNAAIRTVALGAFYGMTLTLLYLDWRLALLAFVSVSIGATTEAHK